MTSPLTYMKFKREEYPVTFQFFREDTEEVVWQEVVELPDGLTSLKVPGKQDLIPDDADDTYLGVRLITANGYALEVRGGEPEDGDAIHEG